MGFFVLFRDGVLSPVWIQSFKELSNFILSKIGPFYPSSYLLLPSFYPKAYHCVIWETEGTGQALQLTDEPSISKRKKYSRRVYRVVGMSPDQPWPRSQCSS